jgi:tetratricopeptide (TPR) repeat protein
MKETSIGFDSEFAFIEPAECFGSSPLRQVQGNEDTINIERGKKNLLQRRTPLNLLDECSLIPWAPHFFKPETPITSARAEGSDPARSASRRMQILTIFRDLFNLAAELHPVVRSPAVSAIVRFHFVPLSGIISHSMPLDHEVIGRAVELFRQAYEKQMSGDLEEAVDLYRESIETFPTAEAHTFLGWTYSFQGRLEEAIAECQLAIRIDPDFGNPYNDIGVYLIELGRPDEAVPWLEKAIGAKRYDAYHYPYYNLGRIYLAKELYTQARNYFERSLGIDPDYELARGALDKLKRTVN